MVPFSCWVVAADFLGSLPVVWAIGLCSLLRGPCASILHDAPGSSSAPTDTEALGYQNHRWDRFLLWSPNIGSTARNEQLAMLVRMLELLVPFFHPKMLKHSCFSRLDFNVLPSICWALYPGKWDVLILKQLSCALSKDIYIAQERKGYLLWIIEKQW